jgi:hypothetical protein
VGVGLSVKVLFIFATAKDFGFAVEFEVDFKSNSGEVGH